MVSNSERFGLDKDPTTTGNIIIEINMMINFSRSEILSRVSMLTGIMKTTATIKVMRVWAIRLILGRENR